MPDGTVEEVMAAVAVLVLVVLYCLFSSVFRYLKSTSDRRILRRRARAQRKSWLR